MNTNRILLWVALMVAAGNLLPVVRQGEVEGEAARGAFLVSRQKASNRPRRPRPAEAKPIQIDASSSPASPASAPSNMPAPLSLGYSIYKNRRNGNPERVSPKQVFVAGDEIKIIVEPSEDGYLYVFYQDVKGEAEMIYPNRNARRGENWIEAHVPYLIPGEDQWIEFDETPATMRLLMVFSRQPLAGVPDRKVLFDYCQNQENCNWPLPRPLWNGVTAQLKLPAETGPGSDLSLTAEDRDTLARGLRIKQKGLIPSVIKANHSAREPVLVIATDLIQKSQ